MALRIVGLTDDGVQHAHACNAYCQSAEGLPAALQHLLVAQLRQEPLIVVCRHRARACSLATLASTQTSDFTRRHLDSFAAYEYTERGACAGASAECQRRGVRCKRRIKQCTCTNSFHCISELVLGRGGGGQALGLRNWPPTSPTQCHLLGVAATACGTDMS